MKDSRKQKSLEVQYICQNCGKGFSLERNFCRHQQYRCTPIPQYDGASTLVSQVNNDVSETTIAAESQIIHQTVSHTAESTETAITAASQMSNQTAPRLAETDNLLVSSQTPFLDNDDPDSSSSSESLKIS